MLGVTENIVHNATKVMDMILQHIPVHCVKLEHIQMEQSHVNLALLEVMQILTELINVRHAPKDNISLKQGKLVAVGAELQNGQIQIGQVANLVQKDMNAMLMLLKNHATQDIILKEV